jgi:uncharacterized protein
MLYGEKMKTIYLIHGWGGTPKSEKWFKWLNTECEKRNYNLTTPKMPNTYLPNLNEWLGLLERDVKNIDNETYFVGHSLGCLAIIKYLETLDSNIKIGGAVFVAPWMKLDKNTIEEEKEESVKNIRPWMEIPVNFSKVKKHTNNFLCILSDNDPYVPLTNKKLFEEKLGAEIIIKHHEEHFHKTPEIKEILDFIR